MSIDSTLKVIIDCFDFSGKLVSAEEIKTGHINVTYHLRFTQPDGTIRDYILQRINSFVFKKPAEVMENVQLVTEHIARAIAARGDDPENRVLRLIPTKDGGTTVLDDEHGFWRAYDFIYHAKTVDLVESIDQFREIGRAFGEFQSMLSDFPIGQLHETILQFHDTRKRLGDFERSIELDVRSRAKAVQPEIEFIRQRGPAMCRIVEMIESGELPLRVTHNDTKINNVMLDTDTGEALCVIDLDTVMPGSVLYDFGDAIRVGACTAEEDEKDLNKVSLDIGLYTAFSDGFISQTAGRLTQTELFNLPLGAIVMTFENAMRFLADYLDGDTYYRIEHPEHNLYRSRCQLKLLSDMEAHQDEMYAIVRRMVEKYR